jgi:hypothetical protein
VEKLRWPLQKNVTCKCDVFTNTVFLARVNPTFYE